MRASRYNIIIPEEPMPGSVLIFNTLSGALYELEPEYCAALARLRDGIAPIEGDAGRLAELASEGFVVGVEAERERVIHHLRTASYTNSALVNAIVVTTMACNLACRYCMESGMAAAPAMSDELTAAIAERLIDRARNTGAEGVAVDFYGGEPLLNPACIRALSGRMREWAADTHKIWRFTLTTNGTLLTPALVEELRPLGLAGVRVSIDGVRALHDARRPFRTGGGSSFDVILENLRVVAPLIPVTLVMTLSPEGVVRLPEFLDLLDREGILPHLAAVSPGIEQAYLDADGHTCGSGHSCMRSPASAGDYCTALRLLVERGISPGTEILQGGNCAVMMNSGILVYAPDGLVYKCPTLMGKPECAVGAIARERFDDRYYELVNRELWRPCLEETDCPYLPMCGCAAGCRYAALLDHGDWMGDACSRGFFDHAVPEWMRLEYMKTMQAHAATPSNT